MGTKVAPGLASLEYVAGLVALVCELRPEWQPGLVQAVLSAHRGQVSAVDLTVASIRGAGDPLVSSPKALMWRGAHWNGLETRPEGVRPRVRCGVCGKPEDRCLLDRPGRDDDHAFEAPLQLAGVAS